MNDLGFKDEMFSELYVGKGGGKRYEPPVFILTKGWLSSPSLSSPGLPLPEILDPSIFNPSGPLFQNLSMLKAGQGDVERRGRTLTLNSKVAKKKVA